MYANFYYHKPSKAYGRGPWLNVETKLQMIGNSGPDPLYLDPECVWIGTVSDVDLFPNELVIE